MKIRPFENIVGKVKMLVTNIFNFSYSVFYHSFSKQKIHFFSHFYFFFCLQMLWIWTSLKDFRLVQNYPTTLCLSLSQTIKFWTQSIWRFLAAFYRIENIVGKGLFRRVIKSHFGVETS